MYLWGVTDIVGNDVVSFAKRAERGDMDLSNVNGANIVLIHKAKEPTFIRHYRSISLCNVLYKIISKTMANHLKQYLLGFIL